MNNKKAIELLKELKEIIQRSMVLEKDVAINKLFRI